MNDFIAGPNGEKGRIANAYLSYMTTWKQRNYCKLRGGASSGIDNNRSARSICETNYIIDNFHKMDFIGSTEEWAISLQMLTGPLAGGNKLAEEKILEYEHVVENHVSVKSKTKRQSARDTYTNEGSGSFATSKD